jgi:hypothetical protein
MQDYVLIILVLVICVLCGALCLPWVTMRRNRNGSRSLKMTEDSASSDAWPCACRVCNTHLSFDSVKPLPKIWYCPGCGSNNHTQPPEIPS